ncbi:MAG: N-acetylmuramoyl-L-alanine amidase [bacterium]
MKLITKVLISLIPIFVVFLYGIIGIKLSPTYAEASVAPKIKILIVAGHEPDYGGAIYKTLKERELNLQLAEKIVKNLEKNPRYDVVVSRDDKGWNPELQSYVTDNKETILSWSADKKHVRNFLTAIGGASVINSKMGHVTANATSSLYLFGINKWANDTKVDMAINIHFNDNLKYKGKPNFEGFSIYIPERQYSNFAPSKKFAWGLLDEMLKINRISSMKEESDGIIEDQELIALGVNNTANEPSVIVEYAYIYEKFMQKKKTRDAYINKAASSTVLAINKYFK